MRGQENGHALLVRQPLDLGPHLRPRLGIEPGRRLVEEEHPRAVHQPGGDVELALHPARVRAHQPVGCVLEAEPPEQLVCPRPSVAARHAVEIPLQQEVLAAGRFGVDPRLLPDDADHAAHGLGVAEDVEAGDRRPALVRQR